MKCTIKGCKKRAKFKIIDNNLSFPNNTMVCKFHKQKINENIKNNNWKYDDFDFIKIYEYGQIIVIFSFLIILSSIIIIDLIGIFNHLL